VVIGETLPTLHVCFLIHVERVLERPFIFTVPYGMKVKTS